jgi:hypothetical protein
MKCHGVHLVCRMQLEASQSTHECKRAGACIFAPSAPDEPKVHCHVCPAKPEDYCERNCLDVITGEDGVGVVHAPSQHEAAPLIQAIERHIYGWRWATYGWQGDADPVKEASNRERAEQAHAAECLRRIRATLGVEAVHASREIKLEVGRCYLDRKGREVKIIERREAVMYPFVGDNGIKYLEHGFQFDGRPGYNESDADLIAEYDGPGVGVGGATKENDRA